MLHPTTTLLRGEPLTDVPTSVLLTSWIYDDIERSRDKATAFYHDIRASLDVDRPTCPFPFAGPWEIALVDAGDCWAVAAWGAWPRREDVLKDILTWLAACGAKDQGFVDRDLRHVPYGKAWTDVLLQHSGIRVVDRFGGVAEHADSRCIGEAFGTA